MTGDQRVPTAATARARLGVTENVDEIRTTNLLQERLSGRRTSTAGRFVVAFVVFVIFRIRVVVCGNSGAGFGFGGALGIGVGIRICAKT